jgi:hypothetical protein
MFVERYFVSGMHVFCSKDEVPRAVVLRADFEHESSGRRLVPNAGLAFIFLKQQWFGGGFRARGRNGRTSRLGNTHGYEHRAREGKALRIGVEFKRHLVWEESRTADDYAADGTLDRIYAPLPRNQ